MSIPAHGPFCQTRLYPTSCWHCRQPIHVLQCTCGSAVLFDAAGSPWPKHSCGGYGRAGGIGGSGLSGWVAVDALRAAGARISPDILGRIFPSGTPGSGGGQPTAGIRKVAPAAGTSLTLLALVRERPARTRRAAEINALPPLGRKLLGLDPHADYRQMTLVRNDIRPNWSCTVLAPAPVVRGIKQGVAVRATLIARGRGGEHHWIVSDIDLI